MTSNTRIRGHSVDCYIIDDPIRERRDPPTRWARDQDGQPPRIITAPRVDEALDGDDWHSEHLRAPLSPIAAVLAELEGWDSGPQGLPEHRPRVHFDGGDVLNTDTYSYWENQGSGGSAYDVSTSALYIGDEVITARDVYDVSTDMVSDVTTLRLHDGRRMKLSRADMIRASRPPDPIPEADTRPFQIGDLVVHRESPEIVGTVTEMGALAWLSLCTLDGADLTYGPRIVRHATDEERTAYEEAQAPKPPECDECGRLYDGHRHDARCNTPAARLQRNLGTVPKPFAIGDVLFSRDTLYTAAVIDTGLGPDGPRVQLRFQDDSRGWYDHRGFRHATPAERAEYTKSQEPRPKPHSIYCSCGKVVTANVPPDGAMVDVTCPCGARWALCG